MDTITIVWGTDKDKTKTYTFKNDEELKFFMMGVDEANGWLEYEIKEILKEGWDVFPPWLWAGNIFCIVLALSVILFV